jgi:ATP/maltotriose-dependent transcriptional regulator MalT
MGGRVASPTLVGRVEELQVLEAARRRAADGEPAVVLVGGEAGVGKTRLVAELTTRCTIDGIRVLYGGCIPVGEGTLPYAPIVEALRALLADLGGDQVRALIGPSWLELAHLLPSLGEPEGDLLGQATQTRLFELLLGLLGRLSDQAPLVLVIEDVHWADHSTRDLLSFLVRNLRRERVLLIVTYRSDEPQPARLGPWLAELDRGPVQRLQLPRFQRAELVAQLTGILRAAPDADLVDAVFARSQGNPFFTEELIEGVRVGSDALPATLRDLLGGRIQVLSAPAQQTLKVAAVAGRPISHRLLAAVAELDDERLIVALREAVAAQLLVARPGNDGYDLRHALLREVVDADLLPGERMALHAAYARVLADRPELADASPAVAAAELAAHWQAASDPVRALPALVVAGRTAEQAGAFPEAYRHYQQGLALWDQVPNAAQLCGLDRVDLLLRAGVAAGQAGHVEPSRMLFAEALDRLDPAADPMRAARLLMVLGRRYWEAGDEPASLASFDKATRLLPAEPSADRARVLAAHAYALQLAGRTNEAAERAEEALAVARRVGARAEEAHALDIVGTCIADKGDVATGIDHLVKARRLAEQVGYPQAIARAYLNLGSLLRRAGRLEESWEVTCQGYEAARRFGIQRAMGSFLAANMASHLLDTGRWEDAERLLGNVLRDGAAAAFRLHLVAGRLDAARGDFAAAQEHLEVAVRSSPSAHERIGSALALAELAIWQGRLEDARALLDTAHSLFDDLTAKRGYGDDLPGWEGVVSYALGLRLEADCAELARAHRSAAGIAEAKRRAEPLITTVHQMLSERGQQAYAQEALVPVYATMGQAEFARLEGRSDPELWHRAATLWDRLSFAYPAAYARFREAEALLASRGPRPEAEQAIQAAHQTVVRLGAAPLRREIEALARRGRLQLAEPTDPACQPKAPRSQAESLGLTPREAEVLALVAEGRTNRQIGQALFITEKTASLHVSHILTKLGVAGRGEAAAVAHRLALDKQ